MWWNWQTRDAQNVVPGGRGSSNLPFVTESLRVGQCPFGPHKPGQSGATPGPATGTTGYANWQSDHVENVMILWVRLPPRSLIHRVVQRPRRLGDNQKRPTLRVGARGSIPAAMTSVCKCFGRHASVVRTKTGFNSRTDLCDERAGMPLGATDPCKVGVMGSTRAPPRSGGLRSTDDERAHGPTGRHRYGMAVIRVRFPVSPLNWKVTELAQDAGC